MDISNSIVETEDIVLRSLLYNKEYIKKVLSFIKSEYFETDTDVRMFKVIEKFYLKYNKSPTKSVLSIYFKDRDKTITEDGLRAVIDRINYLEQLSKEDDYTKEWLLDITEEWVKNKALTGAIYTSIGYLEENSEQVNSIPDLVKDALKITFDNDIGHEYFLESESQLEYYHSTERRYSTNIEMLNKSLGGGFARKTLSVILGPPGGGKSRMMIDLGAHYIREGLNVLYVTMELEERVIRNRFDANMLDIAVNDFDKINKDKYHSKINDIKKKSYGRLIIKEFPSAYANVHHFQNLVDELKLKKEFTADIVIIDYMGEMMSLRESGDNMYLRGRYIASELRGFCMSQNVIGITGWQLAKQGWNVSDVEMGNIAESAGVVHIVDYMGAIAGTEELKEENKFLWVTLKNRLNKLQNYRKVMIGFDDDKMRHYDVDTYDIDVDNPRLPEKDKSKKELKSKFKF